MQGLSQFRLSTADHALSLVAPATTTVCSLEAGLLKVKVKITLRLTVSQSVNLGVEPPSGALDGDADVLTPDILLQARRVPVPDERYEYLCNYFKPLR
jgi:hypothetical protein